MKDFFSGARPQDPTTRGIPSIQRVARTRTVARSLRSFPNKRKREATEGAMGTRGPAIARIARRPAFSPGAALLLSLAAGLAVAAPPDTGVDTATEASPAALSRQTGDSVAVKSLLADDRMLLSWLKDNNKDVLAAAARVDQALAALRQDRLHLNPSLAGSVSDLPLGDTNPPGLTSKDTAIYGTVLSQTVEIGKRGPRIESARLRLESGRRLYLDVLGDTMAQARAV